MMRPEQRFYRGAEADRFIKTRPAADVVIIGGGEIGPATAAALEDLEPTVSSVVLETNDTLAGGASTASAEAFRIGWTPESIARQMLYSIRRFEDPDTYFAKGAAARLNVRQRGYLYLGQEDDIPLLQKTAALMRLWGLSGIEFLDENNLHREFPWIPGHFAGARIDRRAGWLDSNALAMLHAEKTRHARFLLETPAIEIVVQSGEVKGVKTPRGMIYSPNVLIAAGPGSRAIGQTAGIDLPVVCIPRQTFTTSYRHGGIPENSPFIIAPHHQYFRPEGAGLLLGWAYERRFSENGTHSTSLTEPVFPVRNLVDPRHPSMQMELLARQFHHAPGSGFHDPRYLRGVKLNIGYYVYRQETYKGEPVRSERAIIDETDVKGLFISVAHAGHGIMTAPAAAHIAASHITGMTPDLLLFEDFRLHVPVVDHEFSSGL